MKKILFLVSVLAVAVSGCKKDDDDPSNTDKLTGKAWKVTAITVNPAISFGGISITDVYAFLDDCEKDNTSTFNTDKTYLDDEGGSKCDPSDPQTTPGTWAFNSDETILTLDSADSFKVLQNDGNVLKLSSTEVDAGVTYTYTVTFGK
jgi:hypothetical protein